MRGVEVVHRRIPVSHAEITRSYGCISSFVKRISQAEKDGLRHTKTIRGADPAY